MGIFVCDRCDCIENTALGLYWTRNWEDMFRPEDHKIGEALCSECAPAYYNDGTKTSWGKWHDKFLKVKWDGERVVMNR